MNKKEIMVNEKGVLLIVVVMLILAFLLGCVYSEKNMETKMTVFTRDDLERIERLQEIEDENGSTAEVCAYKDSEGNLMISYK